MTFDGIEVANMHAFKLGGRSFLREMKRDENPLWLDSSEENQQIREDWFKGWDYMYQRENAT